MHRADYRAIHLYKFLLLMKWPVLFQRKLPRNFSVSTARPSLGDRRITVYARIALPRAIIITREEAHATDVNTCVLYKFPQSGPL